jgi:cell shape-determining protein MreC
MTLMTIMRVAVPRMIVRTITDKTTVITSKCFLWVIYIYVRWCYFFITTTKNLFVWCEFLFGTICGNGMFLVSDFQEFKVHWIPTFIGKQQLYREYYIQERGEYLFDLQKLEFDFGTT